MSRDPPQHSAAKLDGFLTSGDIIAADASASWAALPNQQHRNIALNNTSNPIFEQTRCVLAALTCLSDPSQCSEHMDGCGWETLSGVSRHVSDTSVRLALYASCQQQSSLKAASFTRGATHRCHYCTSTSRCCRSFRSAKSL